MKDFVSSRRRSLSAWVASFVLVGVAWWIGPSVQAAPAEAQYGTRDQPLDGQRYETLRALTRHLDETARGALEGATDEVRQGTPSAARFLWSIRSFARRAADFNGMIEEYPTSPFEVLTEVDALTSFAHQVNDRIHSTPALESTDDDWLAILDDLERIKLLLAGREVEVPAAHVVAALSGSRLQEFRELARDVDSSATRAHDTAKRDASNYPRGRQFLDELQYFAAQSRSLHSRADAGQVKPQQMGPSVDDLLEEARQADRRMRDALVFTSLWDDSGRTIIMLERMASLVRS